MGSYHNRCLTLTQLLQNGDRQSYAFTGIRSRRHFIEQYKRGPAGCLQNVADVANMRRERTEGMLQTLPISDIDGNLVKDGAMVAFRDRNQQTGLHHYGDETNRLQSRSFAAGIRPCNDQGFIPLPDREVQRYHRGAD